MCNLMLFCFLPGLPIYDSSASIVSVGMTGIITLRWIAELEARYYLKITNMNGTEAVESPVTDCIPRGEASHVWTDPPSYFNSLSEVRGRVGPYITGLSPWYAVCNRGFISPCSIHIGDFQIIPGFKLCYPSQCNNPSHSNAHN